MKPGQHQLNSHAPGLGRRLFLARCLLLLAFGFTAVPVHAATEYEVKAAFLFNFAKFIDWPEQSFTNSSGPVVIGIAGADSFADKLADTVRGETVKGRPIAVRVCNKPDDLAGCHILFISRSESHRASELIRQASAKHILVVSESKEILDEGGMINFLFVGKNVRFDINLPALEQAGLHASSKLLAVARTVKGAS